ncbi:uncharacterized protein [Eucyclogobius newberryi]|uniref:uncharacterized protein n=1 Tax=Eucyclogobius newberryi TaxID=166745 RepID=UPI003B595DFA
MGDGVRGGACSCLNSLLDRLRGQKRTEDKTNQVVLGPVQLSPEKTPRTGSIYVALRDFVAGQEDEMSFQKGERFTVLGRSEQWWTVQRMDREGQVRGTGNVPYNYLERVESLETQPWFCGMLSRSEAEDLIMNSESENGAFLVRRSETEAGYVLSVKSWTPVKHYKVEQDEDNAYHLQSSPHFASLVDLVHHFTDTGLEGIGKLGELCTKKQPEVPDTMPGVSELEFSVPLEEEPLFVALWDFEARQEAELPFLRADRFKVLGRSEQWWKVQKVDQSLQVLASGFVPGIYLEMEETLEAQPWFFGTLSRSETEAILKIKNQNRAWLIRRSHKDSVGIVFSVSTPVNHFKILKNKENNYHLQQTPHFPSVSALVQHYSGHSIASMGILGDPCAAR